MKDFIPQADAKLILWLVNYKKFVTDHGTALGLTAPQVTARTSAIDDYFSVNSAAEAAKNAAQSAIQSRTTLKASLIGDIRKEAGNIKRNAAYTPALGELADIITEAEPFDPATFKTKLTVLVEGGHVVIRFTKGQSEGVNVYARLRGQFAWTFLARDTYSPYVDNRPLATAGVAETREYMARGVLTDAEIGVDSDIVSVVFSD